MSVYPLRVVIAPASSEDAEGAAALLDIVDPDGVHTVAGFRYRMETAQPAQRTRSWKAEQDGDIVGWAGAGLDPFSSDQGRAFTRVAVHPDHRGRGLGGSLWSEVSRHLDEIGAARTVTFSRSEATAKHFAEARGFTLVGTDTSSALDPRTLPEPPEPPEGVEVRALQSFTHDPEPVYRADADSVRDEPGPFDFSNFTFDVWQRHTWNHPDCDREIGAAVVIHGTVVATTFVYCDRDSGRATNGGTGVMRAYRGRGLGLLVKQHSLARAAELGITSVVTQNDDTNAPMLAINRRLGYQPFGAGHSWVLER